MSIDRRRRKARDEHQRALDRYSTAAHRLEEPAWSTPRQGGAWSPAQITQHVILCYDVALSDLSGGLNHVAASSEDGEYRFTFTELAADTPFLFKVDAQVNPDIFGGNEGVVTVYDGEEELTRVAVEIGVLP